MKFARGSEWFALTRDFANYLTAELRKQSSAMHEVWTDALLLYQPDETFFHTALLNSPFCTKHANRHLHYISTILPEKIQHGGQDEIGTRSPAYLTPADFEPILIEKAKRPIFFARKLREASHEPTIKLRKKLDAQKALAPHRVNKSDWPGLQEWLENKLPEWIDSIALQNFTINGSCLDGASLGLRLVRESPFLSGSLYGSAQTEAQWTDLRFVPETWLLEGTEYRLVERFAVPPVRVAAFGMALLIARLGTGWSEERKRFSHVSIVPHGKSLSLVTYWAPHVADVGDLPEVIVDWGSCVVKQQMYDVHFWGSPLVLPSCDQPSLGIRRVRLKLQRGGRAVSLAWRDFLVFDRMEDVRLDHMRRFFALSGAASTKK